MLQCIRLAVRGSRRWGSPLNCSSATFATGNQPHTIDDGGSRTPLPILLILGRPNVGKSTLFNRLAGKRAALVYDTPGSHVTRDYKEGEGRLSDLSFNIVDTSGLEPSMTSDSIQGRATRLTQQLFTRANVCLFVVDSRAGLCSADFTAADWLRKNLTSVSPGPSVEEGNSGKQAPSIPVIVVANKCDHPGDSTLVSNALEAASLGFGNPVPYSAETQAGTADLYDALRRVVDEFHEHQANSQASDKAQTCITDSPGHERQAHPGTTPAQHPRHSKLSPQRPSLKPIARRTFGGWQTNTPPPPSTPPPPHPLAPPQVTHPHGSSVTTPQHNHPLTDEPLTHSALAPTEAPGSSDADSPAVRAGTLGVDSPIKLVLVGLPNAGKSTLLNRLLGYERALAGPEAALTRDAITERLEWRGTAFEVTDTAGWLQRATLPAYDEAGGNVARMTVAQGSAMVNFGHAVVLVVDAEAAHARVSAPVRGVGAALSRRELALAGTVLDEGRLLLIALNKADALPDAARAAVTDALNAQIDSSFASWRDCFSVAWVSGETGHGLGRVLKRVTQLIPKWSITLGSKELNAWRRKMAVALTGNGSQAVTSIRFLKMSKTRPPTVLAEFKGRIVEKSHLSALSRALRTSFGLHGVPVRVVPLSKKRRSIPSASG